MCICHLCLFLGGVSIHDFSHFLIELSILLLLSFLEFFLYFRHEVFVRYGVYKYVLPFCTLSLHPFHMGFCKRKVFYFDEVRFSNFFLLWIKFLLSNLLLVLDPKEFLLPLPVKFHYCTFYMYVHDKSFVNFGVRCEAVLGSSFFFSYRLLIILTLFVEKLSYSSTIELLLQFYLKSVVHICVGRFWGSLFCFIYLYACHSPSYTLSPSL